MKRYEFTPVVPRYDGKRTFLTTRYPKIEASDSDIVVISNEGDYLDSLAYKYYSDPTLWWIIALANNIGKSRLSVPPGLQLRIPTNVTQILNDFTNLNQ